MDNNTDVLLEIAALLQKTNDQLQDIRSLLARGSLGLGPVPEARIYCNRTNGGCWYERIEDENRIIPQESLTGYLRELKFEQATRRGKPTYKMLIVIDADRRYTLESGYDTQFAKGFLAAIATLHPAHLSRPITINPQPKQGDSVLLFCRVYLGSTRVQALYNENTDWREVARRAVGVVKAANPQGDRA